MVDVVTLAIGRLAKLGFWACLAVVVVGSLLPGPQAPGPVMLSDKVIHLMGYGALALCAGLGWPHRMASSGLGLVALGIVLEIAQGTLIPGRALEVMDAAANATGVALGLGLALLFIALSAPSR